MGCQLVALVSLLFFFFFLHPGFVEQVQLYYYKEHKHHLSLKCMMI